MLTFTDITLAFAKKKGIKNLALTDHNTVKGVREAIKEGKRIGVNVIPAVEIPCKYTEILGYFIDIKNKELLKVITDIGTRATNRVKKWCKQLQEEGYDISFKEMKKR